MYYTTEMSTEIAEKPEYFPGSAMAALMPQEASFVEAMVRGGAGPEFVRKAAALAGYSENYGWTLMRKSKILAALREEAAKGLLQGALIGQKVLMEIALDAGHKDRLKAAKELLGHSGFTITQEQKITVEHVSSEARELVKDITDFAKATGLDVKQLLGAIGINTPQIVTDAEFTPVVVDNSPDLATEEVWSA